MSDLRHAPGCVFVGTPNPEVCPCTDEEDLYEDEIDPDPYDVDPIALQEELREEARNPL